MHQRPLITEIIEDYRDFSLSYPLKDMIKESLLNIKNNLGPAVGNVDNSFGVTYILHSTTTKESLKTYYTRLVVSKIIAVVIGSAILFTASCILAQDKIYTNDEYGIKFSYPGGWEEKPADKWEAKNNLLYISFMRPKATEEEFRCGFTISVKEYDSAEPALIDYARKILSKDADIIKEPAEVSLNGHPGVCYEINMEAPSLRLFHKWHIKSLHYLFLKNSKIYRLGFIGEYDIYEAEKEEIERAINSFIIE